MARATTARRCPPRPAPPLSHFSSGIADPTLDPCTDFYQYACGRSLAANPIPADRAHRSTVSNLKQWNQTVLRETLERAAAATDPSPIERQLGDYWTACMDEAGAAAAGLGSLADELRRIECRSGPGARS
jgi:putative endopeptidase